MMFTEDWTRVYFILSTMIVASDLIGELRLAVTSRLSCTVVLENTQPGLRPLPVYILSYLWEIIYEICC